MSIDPYMDKHIWERRKREQEERDGKQAKNKNLTAKKPEPNADIGRPNIGWPAKLWEHGYGG